MTPTQDSTVAARVPIDLRADLEQVAALEVLAVDHAGRPELTPHVRRALREYADRKLGRTPAGSNGLFAPAEGTTRRHDRATSKRAAADVTPRVGTQRFLALEAIAAAGDRGLTTDDVVVALEGIAAPNSTPRRVTDLLEAGAIAELVVNGQEVTRITRHGSPAHVWVATGKGRAWLEVARRNARRV